MIYVLILFVFHSHNYISVYSLRLLIHIAYFFHYGYFAQQYSLPTVLSNFVSILQMKSFSNILMRYPHVILC
jgi:hypothetical protein